MQCAYDETRNAVDKQKLCLVLNVYSILAVLKKVSGKASNLLQLPLKSQLQTKACRNTTKNGLKKLSIDSAPIAGVSGEGLVIWST